MASHVEIPVENHHTNYPPRHHRPTHYYAHRVKESLTTRVSKVICSIFLSLLLFVGIILFILWLNLRPHRPRFYLNNFSVRGLTQENGILNGNLTFNVTDRNPSQKVGIYYRAMDATIYYRDKRIGGTPLLFPLYQPSKNTTLIQGVVSGASLAIGDNDMKRMAMDAAAGRVVFRLQLTSTIRFKVSTWDSHRHRMHVNCNAEVGPDGMILPTAKDKRCTMYFSN